MLQVITSQWESVEKIKTENFLTLNSLFILSTQDAMVQAHIYSPEYLEGSNYFFI